jgi:hypothetical protein
MVPQNAQVDPAVAVGKEHVLRMVSALGYVVGAIGDYDAVNAWHQRTSATREKNISPEFR